MGALLEGFRTGYDRMNQKYQQDENTRRYEQGQERQQGLDQRRSETHDSQMISAGLNQQVAQNQIDRAPILNQQADQQFGLNQQVAQNTVSRIPQANAAQDLNIATAQNSLSSKKATDKQNRATQKLQAAYASQDFTSLVGDKDFEDTDLNLVFSGTGRKAAIKLSDSIASQDWQAAVPAFNQLYKSKLNRAVGNTKGKDGGTVRDVSAVGFEAQEDGSVRIPVTVTTDKGSYPSYISELRSSGKDDPLKNFTVDDLIGKGAALGQLAQILNESGTNEAMGKNAQNYMTQEQKQDGVPAQALNVKYMADAMGIPEGDAWEIMNNAKQNPNSMKLAKAKFVQSHVQSDSDVKLKLATPEERQALVQEGLQMFDKLMADPAQESQGSPAPGNSAPDAGLGQLLEKAKASIASGKDKDAVIQRLIEMGVPQEQIQL